LLLVHAHPDDESLWTGGTIARYAANGGHVTLVTCTLGEEGEIIPDGLALLAASESDQLGGYRNAELRTACAALGVVDHRYLGGIGRWRDSGMVGVASNAHPRAFVQGSLDAQVSELLEIFDEVRPDVVVTYGPDGGYGHPDHIRAHDVTMAACAQSPDIQRVFHVVTSKTATDAGVVELSAVQDLPFRLPLPGELPVTPDSSITTVIGIAEHLDSKLRALRAHQTQISVWQDDSGWSCYALSNDIAQPIVDGEYYILASGSASGASNDLFGGL
jgi:N-acetyl-1-D-myo-inositol-2-amino-2-deoxy-alpha-D-glucopyranoside deacetylase